MSWTGIALAVLKYVPPAWTKLREWLFPVEFVPGVSITPEHRREGQPETTFQYKLYLRICNEKRNYILLESCFFWPKKGFPLRPDPLLKPLAGKRPSYSCCFLNPNGQVHDQPFAFLRKGERTSLWMGVDPTHGDQDIRNALNQKAFGVFRIRVTLWDDNGVAYNCLIRIPV